MPPAPASRLDDVTISSRPASVIAVPKSSAFERLQPLIRHRPPARALHQRVEVALHHLVECGRAARDHAGAEQETEHPPEAERIAVGHRVADERRGHDEQVEPRLRQRDEIPRARAEPAITATASDLMDEPLEGSGDWDSDW